MAKGKVISDDATEILPPAKRPVGRPSMYSQELADEICARIAMGLSVEEVGAQDDMPSERQIHFWKRKHPEFAQAIAHAREEMANKWADRILKASLVALGEKPTDNTNQMDPRMLRVAIDGLDKYARLRAGRSPLEAEGSQTLIQNNYTKIDVRALDADARESLKQALLAAKRAGEGGR